MPTLSIRAEPPVAWVDKNVARHGTRKQAEAYLRFLYSPQGQRLAAKHYYRPAEPDKVPAADAGALPAGDAGDDRRGVRRLEEGAGRAFRRRRLLRPDLPAGTLTVASTDAMLRPTASTPAGMTRLAMSASHCHADPAPRWRRPLPGFGLSLGLGLAWLSLVVLLPLLALAVRPPGSAPTAGCARSTIRACRRR